MFDLEKSIKNWKKTLQKHETFEDGLIADIELHLRDAYDSLKREGFGEEEAFRDAAAQVGTAESIASEYNKNRVLSLNRRSPWRLSRFMPALAWNYVKTAWRKIKRQKGYSFINIAGLAIGIFARKVNSLALGIVFGLAIGFALAFLVAYLRHGYYFEIILPGSMVGVIVGYATQKYGSGPATATR